MATRLLQEGSLPLLDARAARTVASSAIAGQLGGLAFLAVLAVAALISGESAAAPLARFAALFVGPGILHHPSGWAMLLGFFASQLGPALLWSLVFAVLLAALELRAVGAAPLLLGLGVALLAELFDVQVVMPLFQRALHGENLWRAGFAPSADWLAHAAYGFTLGLAYLRLGPDHREVAGGAHVLRDEHG